MRFFFSFFLFFVALCQLKAQSKSFELTDWYNNALVSSGSTFSHNTYALQHHSHSFDFKNKSATTQTYEVIRTDLRRNIVAAGDSAYAHFCVGANCFSSDTKRFTFTVNPGEVYILRFELDEATRVGYSSIEYQILNKNQSNEFMWLYFKYNNVVGITENNTNDFAVSGVYPNPAAEHLGFDVSINQPATLCYRLVNALGQTVRSDSAVINSGKTPLSINVSALESGIYFFTATVNGVTNQQKVIIGR
ncbi:MAG: T9SS type A sorting domain-containing protein [Bacteroidia bacterium]|nr:T9SS type A sorting domain-containing protein [Bacteroidia bacterium]